MNLPDALKKLNKSGQLVRTSDTLNLDTLQYSVYGTVVPATNIQASNLPYAGQSLNVTTGKRDNYAPITVNFTVDNGFNNWWVLWKWLSFINDPEQSILDSDNLTPIAKNSLDKVVYSNTGNLEPYQTKITVYGLDEYNNKKIQWNYSKAFITNLAGISYNYRTPDQMESSFTFTFSQLVAELL